MRKKIIVSRLLVMLLFFGMAVSVIFPAAVAAVGTNTPVIGSETIDFVLVLDCTGTMKNADINKICTTASKMFTDLAPASNTRFTLILFGQNWGSSFVYKSNEMIACNAAGSSSPTYWRKYVTMPLECSYAAEYEQKNVIKRSIQNNYTAEGEYTVVGCALTAAVDVLYRNQAEDAAIVLVSDGRLTGLTSSDKAANGYPYDNAELVELAVNKSRWPIYSIEMDSDNQNSSHRNSGNYNGSRWANADQLFEGLKQTGGTSYAVKRGMDLDATLVEYFFNVYNDFMGTSEFSDPVSKTFNNYKAEFNLLIPEVASETNVVITGANVESVEIRYEDDGSWTNYSKDGVAEDGSVFVRNEDQKYSLLKLIRPRAGSIVLTVTSTTPTGTLTAQSSTAQDLPVGMEIVNLDELDFITPAASSTMCLCRNEAVEFHVFLSDLEGEAIRATDFYANKAKAWLTLMADGKTERIPMNPTDDGYTLEYTFTDMKYYKIGCEIESKNFRKSGKNREQKKVIDDFWEIDVWNYDFEVEVDSAKAVRGESVNVSARFVSECTSEKKTELYNDGGAVLTVLKDGNVWGDPIPMNGTDGGWSTSYTFDSYGEYIFRVTSGADCLHGGTMTEESGRISVENFVFNASIIDKSVYSREGIVTLEAYFTRPDGSLIPYTALYGDEEAAAQAYRADGTPVGEPVELTGGDRYRAEAMLEGCGDLFYEVVSNAQHLGGEPVSARTQTISVEDYRFGSTAVITAADGSKTTLNTEKGGKTNPEFFKYSELDAAAFFETLAYPDGSVQYKKNDLVSVRLTDGNGRTLYEEKGWQAKEIAIDSEGSYTLTLMYSDGIGEQQTDSYSFAVKNRVPVISGLSGTAELSVCGTLEIPLGSFTDADGDALKITADVSGAEGFHWELDDAVLRIAAGYRATDGTPYGITVSAEDSDGAVASASIDVHVTNLPLVTKKVDNYKATIDIPQFLVSIKTLPVLNKFIPGDADYKPYVLDLNSYFKDPEELKINYRTEWKDEDAAAALMDNVNLNPEDGMLTVDIPAINEVIEKNGNLKGTLSVLASTAADSEETSLDFTIELTSFAREAKIITGIIVAVAAVVSSLTAFVIKTGTKIGNLRIESCRVGTESLVPNGFQRNNAVGGRKKSLKSLFNLNYMNNGTRAEINTLFDLDAGGKIVVKRKFGKAVQIQVLDPNLRRQVRFGTRDADMNTCGKKGYKLKKGERVTVRIPVSGNSAVDVKLFNDNY